MMSKHTPGISNKLHELALYANKGLVWYKGELPEKNSAGGPFLETLVYWLRAVIPNAVSFNLGDVEGLRDINGRTEDCKFPYQTMWVEFDDICLDQINHVHIGILIEEIINTSDQRQWNYAVFIFEENRWYFCNMGRMFPNKATTIDLHEERIARRYTQIQRFALKVICQMCLCLQCSNVVKKENKISRLRQSIYKKRGVPLSSTWTLHLSPNVSDTNTRELGGTHASPRVHLRRGHRRQYSPGKYTWVQQCIVRGKSEGIVFKDYCVHADSNHH